MVRLVQFGFMHYIVPNVKPFVNPKTTYCPVVLVVVIF